MHSSNRHIHRPKAFSPSSWRAVLLTFCLAWPLAGLSQTSVDLPGLLREADAIKTSDHQRFTRLLEEIQENAEALSKNERDYLKYLRGWKLAYDADYKTAIPLLEEVMDTSEDVTLRFRSGTTVANVLAITTQYREAFSRLTGTLTMLPKVSDGTAREQGLGVAAFLYNQVGEYELGLRYANTVVNENWAGRGMCNGGQLKIEALYKSGQLTSITPLISEVIEFCEKLGENIYASVVRTYVARMYLDAHEPERAIEYLEHHYESVRSTGYRRLLAEYDALLALSHRKAGNSEFARKHALRSIESASGSEFAEPAVIAYRVLFEVAEERGELERALQYHKNLAEADKGYLDDISARQIAYEKVRHELLANQLEIDALNKQNEILQLERENNRLYIALLISILAFIGLWAYKTKRLQMHFMRLSQRDGLTGIANRPHFIQRAEHLLEASRKGDEELCVVLTDLDYFKAINDRFGHATGDFVLTRTVEVCQKHMRPQDLFGRFGGEEFGIVLAGCELAVAKERCEELRAAIESVTAPEYGMHSNITASFGVASARNSGYDLRTLLAHADAALYQAKREGRNCVIAYEPKRGGLGTLAEQNPRRAGAA